VPPNIVFLHSHDTGRHVQPYGQQMPTPNIQRLAEEGVLFRHAFSAAPVCSPSRAALLTGEPGMLGLAHRGFRLADYGHHLVHVLRAGGYRTAMIGEQHVAPDPAEIGYDEILEGPLVPTAVRWLQTASAPFFLSVGFTETHRPWPDVDGEAPVPAHLPDAPEIRRDMAGFRAAARALDDGVGRVLEAISDEHTLVILTTDHGLPVPGAKATLTDRGLGVMLILRGPGFGVGQVSDELVSQLDLFPTICELAGIARPGWVRGRSLLSEPESDAVFAELTFHAAYEPQRAVRTKRYKYIRRFDNGHEGPVLANIDDSPSKTYLLQHGLAERALAAEELYDLVFDPLEADNLAGDAAHAATLSELRDRLHAWMAETGDPLLDGPVEPPPGAVLNLPGQVSPDDPTVVHG
jgi:arylsulfatase A-like enzyme